MGEYSLGHRYHVTVPTRERKTREEQYNNFHNDVMEELQRDFAFVTQLKFKDENIKAKIGGDEYGFLTMEMKHKLKMKEVKKE